MQDETSDSSESLLNRIASGEKSAEQQLVNRYWHGVYAMLYRDTQDPTIASDLTQEALCVALVKARDGQIREANALTSFVHQTATNLLIALKRKEKRQNTYSYADFDVLFTGNRGPAEVCEHEQLVDLVTQILEQMPVKRDRTLLLNYFVYGINKVQLCSMMNLTPEHFDRVLYRARTRLKQKLLLVLGEQDGNGDNRHILALVMCFLSLTFTEPDTAQNIFTPSLRDNSAIRHLNNYTNNLVSVFDPKGHDGEGENGVN
jgi:RNA polymerase sigma-70 factor (ECF subfamily)